MAAPCTAGDLLGHVQIQGLTLHRGAYDHGPAHGGGRPFCDPPVPVIILLMAEGDPRPTDLPDGPGAWARLMASHPDGLGGGQALRRVQWWVLGAAAGRGVVSGMRYSGRLPPARSQKHRECARWSSRLSHLPYSAIRNAETGFTLSVTGYQTGIQEWEDGTRKSFFFF